MGMLDSRFSGRRNPAVFFVNYSNTLVLRCVGIAKSWALIWAPIIYQNDFEIRIGLS